MSRILKHKVGDLVTVSYEKNRIGIVTEVRKSAYSFPYKIQWLVEGRITRSNNDFGHYSEGVVVALEEK